MSNIWQPQFGIQDYKILQQPWVYEGYCPIRECHYIFRMFNGEWSKECKRELIIRPKVVAVLLFDPKRDVVLMIEQIRVGAFHTQESPWLLEIVAGMVDPGESLEEAARREALEEAGIEILSLHEACTFLVSPGVSDEETKVYCGIIDAPAQAGHYGLVEDGEDIKVHIIPTLQAIKLLEEGKITSASAVIAIQWLALNRDHLYLAP